MCGIIGYTGKKDALPIFLRGLKLLEYRGYDSSGVSLGSKGRIRTYKKAGKLAELESILPGAIQGMRGHRAHALGDAWRPDRPQRPSPCRLAGQGLGSPQRHHRQPRGLAGDELEARGRRLRERDRHRGDSPARRGRARRAARGRAGGAPSSSALARLQGTFGLAILFADYPGLVVGARNGSPLVLGIGEGECFLASDPAAFGGAAREAVFLRDGEIAVLRPGTWETRDFGGARVEKRGRAPRRGGPPRRARRQARLAPQGDPRGARRGARGPWATAGASSRTSAPPSSAASASSRGSSSPSSASSSSAWARASTPR